MINNCVRVFSFILKIVVLSWRAKKVSRFVLREKK